MNKKCGVKGCKEEVQEAWIDVYDNMSKEKGNCGRIYFCNKHFDIIMPYIQKKEKEMQKEEHKQGKFIGWAFAPLSLVEEALNK